MMESVKFSVRLLNVGMNSGLLSFVCEFRTDQFFSVSLALMTIFIRMIAAINSIIEIIRDSV